MRDWFTSHSLRVHAVFLVCNRKDRKEHKGEVWSIKFEVGSGEPGEVRIKNSDVRRGAGYSEFWLLDSIFKRATIRVHPRYPDMVPAGVSDPWLKFLLSPESLSSLRSLWLITAVFINFILLFLGFVIRVFMHPDIIRAGINDSCENCCLISRITKLKPI